VWACGQPSDRGQLRNRIECSLAFTSGLVTLLASRCGCPICLPSVELMKLGHRSDCCVVSLSLSLENSRYSKDGVQYFTLVKLPKRLGLLTEELEKCSSPKSKNVHVYQRKIYSVYAHRTSFKSRELFFLAVFNYVNKKRSFVQLRAQQSPTGEHSSSMSGDSFFTYFSLEKLRSHENIERHCRVFWMLLIT